MTKAELYKLVDGDRRSYGLKSSVDAVELTRSLGVYLDYVDFRTPGLRGVAYVGEGATFLNKRLTRAQHNFHAAHELFHHLYHKDTSIKTFECYGHAVGSDPYYEWEANEGAAEMLVPYRSFLCFVAHNLPRCRRDLLQLQAKIAFACNVPVATAALRFESLKYELAQYLGGTPIDEIEILSAAQQEERGVCVKSMSEAFPVYKPAAKAIDVWAEV